MKAFDTSIVNCFFTSVYNRASGTSLRMTMFVCYLHVICYFLRGDMTRDILHLSIILAIPYHDLFAQSHSRLMQQDGLDRVTLE